MKHKIIFLQGILLAVIFLFLYVSYPRANLEVRGGTVEFKSINSNVILLSDNPDFSNPRYFEVGEGVSLSLQPGKYYWKSANSMIESYAKSFAINSEVGLEIEKQGNDSSLVNVGNVKINVTKNKAGTMVGHIILEPEEGELIENQNENYTGRQS